MTDANIGIIDVYTKQIQMDTKLEQIISQLPDHETRIRSLEKWKYSLPLTAFMSAGSIALAVFSIVHH